MAWTTSDESTWINIWGDLAAPTIDISVNNGSNLVMTDIIQFKSSGYNYFFNNSVGGTIALTSDITDAAQDYVTTGTTQTISGYKTFSSGITFSTNGEGIILSSPNGTQYKVTFDDSGNLVSTSV